MKLSRALFDTPNSEKDPLGFGDSSTFDDHEFSRPAIYGMAKSMHEKRKEIHYEVWFVVFLLALTVMFAKVVSEARAEDRFQMEQTK